MKELVKLAQEKGFEPKTFSTKWTFETLLGIKKDFFVNEQCFSTLLAEIQKWLIEEYNIIVYVVPYINAPKFSFIIFKNFQDLNVESDEYSKWDQALELGLIEAIILIPEKL